MRPLRREHFALICFLFFASKANFAKTPAPTNWLWFVKLSWCSCPLSSHGDDHCIVGDGGEMNLSAGLCIFAPSHSANVVPSFPGAEDPLHPASNSVDRLVKGLTACACFGFVTSLCRSRRSAVFHGAYRTSEMIAPVGAVSKTHRRKKKGIGFPL